MSKSEQLTALYDEYKIKFGNEEIVLGEGNLDSKLLLIGEAPGKDEVKLSKPFVGAAGKNLMEFLGILDIHREDIFITNSIKYRLSKINEKTGRVVNKPATKEDIKKNRDYLLREINIIKPQIVVTLGNVPLKALTDDYGISMGEVHGKLRETRIAECEYKLYPLYHPASIIYNSSLKEVYMSDIKNLKIILDKNFITI